MSKHRLILFLVGMLVLSAPHGAGAAGMDIGMSTWFCWWQPSWNNNFSSFRVTPTFFYGPGLSFRLPANVTISSGFLYARVKAKGGMVLMPTAKQDRVIERYDSDSTLGYSFARFFKLFAGFKYSHYIYQETAPAIMPGSMVQIIMSKMTYNEYAPALGVAFTVNLIEHFYLFISASCVYMFSSVKSTSRNFVMVSGMSPMLYTGQPNSWSVNKMGANAQVSFAYLIQPINTSISIGFRYQFYKTVKSDTEQDQYTHYYDHFYGVTASAVYRIDFEEKKAGEEDMKE